MSSLLTESQLFLGHQLTLWKKSMGDPLFFKDSSNEIGSQKEKQKEKGDGRFVPGRYTFLFPFPFPAHADPITISSDNPSLISPFRPLAHEHVPNVSGKKQETFPFMSPVGTQQTDSSSTQIGSSPTSSIPPRHSLASPLPQSFIERGIDPNVAYEISVRIVHGRLRASSKCVHHISVYF